MGLRYKFRRARQIIAAFSPEDRRRLERIAAGIQAAEEALLRRAAVPMAQCLGACRGLCCRNADLDAIIATDDLVYLLARAPGLEGPLAAGLAAEEPLFTADCPFLKDGVGPCIFPPDLRPEVCLTTFCGDTADIRREIRRLKRAFLKLAWFVRLRRLPAPCRTWLNLG
jgi:hypothetical protein